MTAMFDNWKGSVNVIVLLAISIIVFNYAIQPVLVSIDPMFADQYVPPGETTRRVPATPDEWATLGTSLIVLVIYIWVVKPYFLGEE